jgi:hypothetical protein
MKEFININHELVVSHFFEMTQNLRKRTLIAGKTASICEKSSCARTNGLFQTLRAEASAVFRFLRMRKVRKRDR